MPSIKLTGCDLKKVLYNLTEIAGVGTMSKERYELSSGLFAFLLWSAIFGVLLGVSASVLSGTLPPEPVTRALILGGLVTVFVVTNKIVVRRFPSVGLMILIASFIGIFTFYLGPPNPFKPLFFFAGLLVDVIAYRLTLPRLLLAIALYGPAAIGMLAFTVWFIDPGFVDVVLAGFVLAVIVWEVIAIPTTLLVWTALRPNSPSTIVARITNQINRNS